MNTFLEYAKKFYRTEKAIKLASLYIYFYLIENKMAEEGYTADDLLGVCILNYPTDSELENKFTNNVDFYTFLEKYKKETEHELEFKTKR